MSTLRPTVLRPLAPAAALAVLLSGWLPSSPPTTRAAENPAAASPAAPARPGLPVATLQRDNAVDFESEILPALRNNCLACHNTTKAKGGLNLETPQLIRKGGDNGPAAIPGKGADSLLFKAAAHLDPEMIMPPKDNKANAGNLTPEQLALVRLWIDQGAKGEVRAATPVRWLEKPPVLDPILALDLTPDGQFTACSRGHRVDLYHVPSGQRVARLADPRLEAFGLTNAAHRDLVNAVAFHPDGTRLATAGFRDVKIWRRDPEARAQTLTNTGALFAVSPDGRRLVTSSSAPSAGADTNQAPAPLQLQVLDAATGTVLLSLAGASNPPAALAFSPDGTRLAAAAGPDVLVWTVPAAGSDTNSIPPATSTTTPAPIHALAWIANGQELALAGQDGLVRAGAWTNLSALRELKGHTGPVLALAAPAHGTNLASAGADGIIRLWDVATGSIRRQLTQEVAVAALAFRPDGRRLASAGTNAIVRLWDLDPATGAARSVADLKGDRRAYELVAERDRALVIANADVAFHKKSLETAQADLKKAEERIAKAAATNTVTEKIFLEKEKALRAATDAKAGAEKALTALLAEIQRVTETYEKADKASREATTKATEAAVHATEAQLAADRAALSKADAERIATDTASVANRTKAAIAGADAAKDTAQRIADESAAVADKSRAFAAAVTADADMKIKLATDRRAAAEKAIADVAALAFAAGQLKPAYDKTLAEAPEKRKQATNQVQTASKSVTDAEQDLKRAETRKSVTGHELELANSGGLRVSNVVHAARSTFAGAEGARKEAEAALERARQQAAAAEQPAIALAFSPDGRTLASLSTHRRVLTWNADTGAPYDVLPRTLPAAAADVAGAARSLAFLGTDRVLAPIAPGQATAWMLNPAWTLERTLGTGDIDSMFADRVNAVRFSHDGRLLATGGGEPTRSGEVKLFQVADGRLVREISDVHSDAVLSLDFSPDGRHLASSSADRFVKVADLATGKVVKAFEGHTSYVLGVAWKRDSRTLVSAGADKVIKVWDFVTGDRRKNIEGADKDVTGVAYVGVTDQVVATSGDNQVRLLKESGEKVRSFEGPADFMNSAAATPDGRVIAAGGQDGRLLLWNGTTGSRIGSFEPEN